jgi:hypothetical protein
MSKYKTEPDKWTRSTWEFKNGGGLITVDKEYIILSSMLASYQKDSKIEKEELREKFNFKISNI